MARVLLKLHCSYQTYKHVIKINETRYIALFVVNRSIKKLLSIYYVNIEFSD